jgi:hypothetical protein
MAARGVSEVHVLRTRLKAAFARAKTLEGGDPEVLFERIDEVMVFVESLMK